MSADLTTTSPSRDPAAGHLLRASTSVGLRPILRGYWNRLRASLRSRRWWVTNVLVLGFWVLIGWPVYQKSIGQGIIHTLVAILALSGRAIRYSGAKTTQLVPADYLERKALLYALIKTMQRRDELAPAEVAAFRQDALKLIANYVRSHRADTAAIEIFVNLMIEDGEDLVVVARDRDHRQAGARYPKRAMLAWAALESGETVATGDLASLAPQYPGDGARKNYRSVMVLPVRGDGGAVVGVVSIDSSRPHHFDIEISELERSLAPYVCILAWTLRPAVIKLLVAGDAK